jgi:hypothetical protein
VPFRRERKGNGSLLPRNHLRAFNRARSRLLFLFLFFEDMRED